MGAEDQEHLNALMSGRMHNAWTASRASAGQARHGQQLLFKYVRANGLLPWFLQQPLQHKPLLLMRHPLDIVTSQVRAFGPRPMEADPEVAFPGHVALQRAWPELKRIEDDVERQLHIWALTEGNLGAACRIGRGGGRTIAIRCIRANPSVGCWTIGIGVPQSDAEVFFQRVDPGMISDTDFQGDRLKDQQAQLASNTRLSPTRRAQLQSVLDLHGIGLYHMGDISLRRQRQAVQLHLLDHGRSPLFVGLMAVELDVVQKRQVRLGDALRARRSTPAPSTPPTLVMMASLSA